MSIKCRGAGNYSTQVISTFFRLHVLHWTSQHHLNRHSHVVKTSTTSLCGWKKVKNNQVKKSWGWLVFTVHYLEATTPAEFGTLFDASLWVGTVWVSRALSAQHPLVAANFGRRRGEAVVRRVLEKDNVTLFHLAALPNIRVIDIFREGTRGVAPPDVRKRRRGVVDRPSFVGCCCVFESLEVSWRSLPSSPEMKNIWSCEDVSTCVSVIVQQPLWSDWNPLF